MEILRTIYLHPELSLRRLILRSINLVNNGCTRRGKLGFTFQELEGRHCTVQGYQYTQS